MTTALALGVGLVLYGTAINLVPLRDRIYLTLNIGAAGIAVVAALSIVDPSAAGFQRPSARAIVLSGCLVAAAVVGVVLLLRAAGRSNRIAALLDDERVAGLDTSQVVERATLRIPVGTAAFEEIAFRGALLGALMSQVSTPAAVAASSAAFGLWHVAPTWQYLRANRVRARVAPITLAVIGAAAGGAVLCALRLATEGLLVPWVAHSAVNVGALVATHLHRHRDDQRE